MISELQTETQATEATSPVDGAAGSGRKGKQRRTGQIIPRNKERTKWLIRVYLGDAHYHNKTFHGVRKEADKWLAGALTRLSHGEPIEEHSLSFDGWLTDWLELRRPSLKPRSYEIYADAVNRIIRPALGSKDMNRIQPADIQKLYRSRAEQGITAHSTRIVHGVLTNIFKLACRQRGLKTNPMLAVVPPRVEKREMSAFTVDQMRAFLAAVEPDFKPWFLFLFETGVRPGELQALKWADINFDKGTATIQRSLARLDTGEWILGEPKTKRSRRTIPLSGSLVSALKQHRLAQNESRMKALKWSPLDLVFCNPATGEPFNKIRLTYEVKRALKAASLPMNLSAYSTRHTAATLLMVQSVPPKVVSERLGHSAIGITLDTYSHVLEGMQQDATDKLATLISS
jgi:integrase